MCAISLVVMKREHGMPTNHSTTREMNTRHTSESHFIKIFISDYLPFKISYVKSLILIGYEAMLPKVVATEGKLPLLPRFMKQDSVIIRGQGLIS